LVSVRQLAVGRMANFCYLVGDEETGTCAVIDPAAEPNRILKEADRAGWTITHVINTHAHSDHIAANARILDATGAKLFIHQLEADRLRTFWTRTFTRVLGGRTSPEADRLLWDGNRIDIGQTHLDVLHTPGHTMGSICLYTDGHVFTGDTLFVGAVGRTDMGGGSYYLLIQSIRDKLYTLPDETVVWPGHDYGPSKSSTVRHERETNPETL
jgi:glyoxylase-like metal-dependent hydrolase (beta-lactamase superfamily II)